MTIKYPLAFVTKCPTVSQPTCLNNQMVIKVVQQVINNNVVARKQSFIQQHPLTFTLTSQGSHPHPQLNLILLQSLTLKPWLQISHIHALFTIRLISKALLITRSLCVIKFLTALYIKDIKYSTPPS